MLAASLGARRSIMVGRTIAWSYSFALASMLLGCDAPANETSPAASPAAASPTAVAVAKESPPVSAPKAAADPLDPCTWVTTDEVNRALSTSLSEPTKTKDDGRQIATCNWTLPGEFGPVGIVDIGVSLVPGAEAYQTNFDLAPAYFDGDATPISIAGAEKAYQVIKKGQNASVVGMLVGTRFVLLQVAIEGVKPEQSQALAAQLASRID
jgi:hypothetical protein